MGALDEIDLSPVTGKGGRVHCRFGSPAATSSPPAPVASPSRTAIACSLCSCFALAGGLIGCGVADCVVHKFGDIGIGDRTGWLGRQDSNLRIRNCARLGLPHVRPKEWQQIVRLQARARSGLFRKWEQKFLMQRFESCRPQSGSLRVNKRMSLKTAAKTAAALVATAAPALGGV